LYKVAAKETFTQLVNSQANLLHQHAKSIT
jgi:hypothetical protein